MKIERKLVKVGALRGWEYSDPAVNEAALELAAIGFNLGEFDSWLLASDPPFAGGAAARILVCRQRLLAATIAGNLEARDGWANYLHLLHAHNRREVFLQPLARIGKQVKHKLAAPGHKATIYTPKHDGVAIVSRNARVVEASAAGDSAAAIAAREGITARTVYRIRATHTP